MYSAENHKVIQYCRILDMIESKERIIIYFNILWKNELKIELNLS